MKQDAAALLGRTFGEFTVRELLSTGGFGMVFRAEQPALAREAVIKVLHTRLRGSETIVQRFLREAQLASKLDHPYAAHTYAFGAEPDGVLWIAMELVRGTPLDKLLEAQGPIPLERFVPLLDRICEVIHTAHEQGIVHRDLKPANVMVLSRAGRLLPKLLDLGLAKLAGVMPEAAPVTEPSLADTVSSEPPSDGRLTQDGATMGSPVYMAPEQWVDAATADARTDQYALAILCYEALTGKPPFAAASQIGLAMAHARQAPAPLEASFPLALDAVLARALAKQAADRYPSVLAFGAAFRLASAIGAEPVQVPRLPERQRIAAETAAPQPLAQAVAALDAARNSHQARDALWQVVRVAVRTLAVTALACHGHIGSGSSSSQSSIGDVLRSLRRRGLSEIEWLNIARELCRPFVALRDAHPIPELVALVCGETPTLDTLLALRASSEEGGGGNDEQVRELLARALPLTGELLDQLAFLAAYPLVVPRAEHAEVWMGARQSPRRLTRLAGKRMDEGQPALIDASGVPIVSLWPYLQILAPTPGAAEHVFFFEGKGRRGARLIALPDAFEHEDEGLWDAFGGILGDTPDPQRSISGEERSPFPGLSAFTRDDAGSFFGRELESEAFLNRLLVQPLLAVVGPSGAGKSSFVQAGVIPALPAGWQAITVRPGPAPLASLAAKLAAAGIDAGDLRAELQEHPGALGSILRAARRGTIVLVIDQLEELFTMCEDPAERALYAEALARAARLPDDPVRVVVTLRDDFLLHAESLPGFRTRLGQGLQLLTTPAPADLRRILVEPIARAGYEFDDPALPDEMVAEIADAPGALALLSFTASRLWELRDRRFRQLGRKAYTSLGGVGGALAQHAESTLQTMSREEQRLVREVFRHLVTAEGTRATMSRAELDQVLGGGPHAAAGVEKLVAARLLVVSEEATGGDRVEVTHEALLDAWPRLVGWRREDTEGARLRDQLRSAARQWEERGRASGLLWRGDALAEYRRWRTRVAGAMTDTEEAFAAASLGDEARGRRNRRIVVSAGFVALAGVVVSLLFLNARASSQRERAEASATSLHDNLERQYENQGRRLLLEGDPLQALAYLSKAAELGADGPAHDFLVAQALRETDGELFEVAQEGPIWTVSFSHDGTRLVTGGAATGVRVWDARSGDLLLTLEHAADIFQASFSPDDRTILTFTDADRSAILWDAQSGRRRFTLSHDDGVQCGLYSHDGALVGTASRDGAVKVWDAATGALRVAMNGAPGEHRCDLALDGTRIAAADSTGTTRVWDTVGGKLLAELAGHHAAVSSVAFSPDGGRLVIASHAGTAIEWDISTARPLHELAHAAHLMSSTFSPDGRRIATASNDGTAAVWDADSGERVLTLSGHAAGVNDVVFSPDGRYLATASDDGTGRLWDATTGRMLSRWLGHRDALVNVEFDRSGTRVATTSFDGTAIVWSARLHEDVIWLSGHDGVITEARFSPDGSRLATSSRDQTARIWDTASGRQLFLLPHEDAVKALAYDREGRRLATASGGTIRIWDASTGDLLRTLVGHARSISDLYWLPDGDRLMSVGVDDTVRIWSSSTGAQLLSIDAVKGSALVAAAATPDGTRIVVASADNVVRVYDSETGATLASHEDPDSVASIAFDPSGTMVASSVANRAVKIWSLATGRLVMELVGHVGQTVDAAWSPDGRTVITAGLDGTARIWEISSGDLLWVIEQGQQVRDVEFSPDGARVVTAADDGTAAIRELARSTWTPEKLDALIRCRVPYRVADERVVSTKRDPTACTQSAR